MVTLEQLRKRREHEALKYRGVTSKLAEKREKQVIRQDIRKIKSAAFSGKFGISKERVQQVGSMFKFGGKGLMKAAKGIGRVALAVGQSANEYTAQQQRQKKRR